MTNLDSVLKSWVITLLTKILIVKDTIFPVVVYRCESWTINTAEHWRIDAFELWRWRKLLRVPGTARRSRKSILKEINPECSLEWLILKLKSQYFGTWCEELIHWRRPSCWKRLKAKREGGSRGWNGWIASMSWRIWIWANSRRWWRTGEPGVLRSIGLQRVRHDLATKQQQMSL